nr:hypothetical protein [Candidatus Sigynarchaeota archaeon]
MFDYIIKGTIIQARQEIETTAVADRLFDNLTARGSYVSTMALMGLELGSNTKTLAKPGTTEHLNVMCTLFKITRIQRFPAMADIGLRLARFIMITWRQDPAIEPLVTAMQHAKKMSRDARLCIAVHLGDADNRDLTPLLTSIESIFHEPCTVATSAANFLDTALENVIMDKPGISFLPVGLVDELGPARPRPQGPQGQRSKIPQASPTLVDILCKAGAEFDAGNKNVIIPQAEWLFKVSMDGGAVYVCPTRCLECSMFPCENSFSKLCIVPSGKDGYAPDPLGLRPSDLFYLAEIFAIENHVLPEDVMCQFPKKKNCGLPQIIANRG